MTLLCFSCRRIPWRSRCCARATRRPRPGSCCCPRSSSGCPPSLGSAPEGAGGVAIDLGEEVVQARRGFQGWVAEPAAVAIGPVQGPAAVVVAKLCDLQPTPLRSEVLAPGRPPLDDCDGRATDDGLEVDLLAGVRRHASLAVAADAGDVGLGRAGRGGHCGMLSPSAPSSVATRAARCWRQRSAGLGALVAATDAFTS